MSYGYPLDMLLLRQRLADCDAEAIAAGAPIGRRAAAEALAMELWRQRHELVAAATAHARQALDVARPFARLAAELPASAVRVELSIAGVASPIGRLKATDFFRAADLVRSA